MGTIYDKITRSLKISEYLISELGLENEKENILRTVKLSKADLVTNVIGEKEFTKLQGFMGSIYAEKQSENKNVALGIFEHYLPRYQGDKLPSTVEGAISGISDKIDTVVGCFSVGLKPTSSKDPYALRRAVQGIVQVILNSKLQIDYKKLINKTYEIFSEDKKILSENVANDVIELFKQRISNVLSEKFNKELVSYEINLENNLVKLENKLSVLLELSKTKDFEILINLLKRVKNIVKDINKEELVSEDLFEKEEEKELFNLGIELEKLELEEFSKYIEVLLKNANVINNYFDNIKINTEDEKIKNNRVATLKKLEKSIDKMISI